MGAILRDASRPPFGCGMAVSHVAVHVTYRNACKILFYFHRGKS